jgi:CheY-like chemotaxis protein
LPRAAVETVSEHSSGKGKSDAPAAPSNNQPIRPLRILFADDQKDIRTITAYQLKRRGHKVVAAKNGKEALQRFRSGKFDAVLLDQEMPVMTGDEVARAIRKGEAGKRTRALLVASTGNTGADDIRRLKAAGFDSVLGKPFHLEDLQAILSSASVGSAAPAGAGTSASSTKIDFADILARVGGDTDLLKRMIATFLRDTPKRVSSLSAALRRRDAAAVASLAHALKGSISIFGAETPRLHAQEVQEFGRAGDLAAAGGLLTSLKEEIANLLENLRGYANQTPARPASNRSKRPRPPRKRGKRRG